MSKYILSPEHYKLVEEAAQKTPERQAKFEEMKRERGFEVVENLHPLEKGIGLRVALDALAPEINKRFDDKMARNSAYGAHAQPSTLYSHATHFQEGVDKIVAAGPRKPYRISPEHYADLKANAENNPDCMVIFKQMQERGFHIDPNMSDVEKQINDYSIYFLYPNRPQ